MKFSEFNYQRPAMKKIQEKFRQETAKFISAADYASQSMAIKQINFLRNKFESMQTIAQIRHSIDKNDKFYEQEQDFFDENSPLYQELISEYYKALVSSKFRKELERDWGERIFSIAELTLKTFSPEIIKELQLENKLSSEYTKLVKLKRMSFVDNIRKKMQEQK